jgi:hypothetical protein
MVKFNGNDYVTITLNIPNYGTLDYGDYTRNIVKSLHLTPVQGQFDFYKDVEFRPSSEEFVYGSCACNAIGEAFEIKKISCDGIASLLGYNMNEGLDFYESNKLIKVIASFKKKKVSYHSNRKDKISFIDFCKSNKKGIFILSMDNHLSILKDGVVIDSYYYRDYEYITKLIGYWKIK